MASTRIAPGRDRAPHEKCGILRGHDEVVATADETANVSPTPETAFEIDPAALLAAHRDRRAGGPAVIGFFHTHPSGIDAPSVTDAACAAPDGRLWLIATATHARLWRAVPAGTVQGRFVPVRFALRTGSRVEKNVPRVQRHDIGPDILAVPDPESPS